MVVPPSPSLFVSHFPVLMSAPSHQHSSSSSSRMDARPLVGGTRPTTPPPKQNHIDMCTVRGWATTPRPPRPRHPPLDLQDPDTPYPLGEPKPTIAGPAHATPGAVFGWPPPHQPPPTLGRGPSVGHFLSTPYPRCPSRTPVKRGRHPRPSLSPRASGTRAQGAVRSAPCAPRSGRDCRGPIVDPVPTDAQGHPAPKRCCTLGPLCHPGASSACIRPFQPR